MADAYESGEVRVLGPVYEGEALARACHAIIDAASALVMNVDLLAQAGGDSGDRQAAVEDARRSVERIVKIAEAIRKGEAEAVDSRRPAGRGA